MKPNSAALSDMAWPIQGWCRQAGHDRRTDVLQRQHALHDSRLHRGTRHTPDHRAGFVLGVNGGAERVQLAATLLSVAAHAGQDDRQHVAAETVRRRLQQRIDGRAAKVDRRPLVEVQRRMAAAAADQHVVITRRQPHRAGLQIGAVRAFAHAQLADAVQAFGQHAREHRWHVLGDHHRHRQIGGQVPEHLGQGVGAAGGGADGQQPWAMLAGTGRRWGRRDGDGSRYRGDASPHRLAQAQQGANLARQLVTEGLEVGVQTAGRARLGDIVAGAPGEIDLFFVGMTFFLPAGVMAMSMGNMLIGEEGQAVWRIYASPVSPKNLVKSKLFFLLVFSTAVLLLTGAVGTLFYRPSLTMTIVAFLEGFFIVWATGSIALSIGFKGADFSVARRARMIRQEWSLISLIVCALAGLAVLAPLIPFVISKFAAGFLGGGAPADPVLLSIAVVISGVIASIITAVFYKINIKSAADLLRKAEV